CILLNKMKIKYWRQFIHIRHLRKLQMRLKVKNVPTKRAADFWESARFTSIFLASGFFYISNIVHARPHAMLRERKPLGAYVQETYKHEVTMQSTAINVTDYLDEVPIERKAALIKLRNLCRTSLKGFQESMIYGGPCYSRNGEVEVGFASQKHFIGLYILRLDVMDAHRGLLKIKGVTLGKGCIRYAKPEKIDFNVVEKLLKATQKSTGVICGHNGI
ncbi:MAG: DUF1801 domain-containing protein, partial [Anaerolineales bacterium]|nr:DUF1801 domain-containing protein [Anaerolineales bacterium]